GRRGGRRGRRADEAHPRRGRGERVAGPGFVTGVEQAAAQRARVPRPAAVMFDLDGTLVDTVGTRIDSWLEAFERFGYPATRDQIAPLIGIDGRRLAGEVAQASGRPIDRDRAEEIDKACGEIFGRRNRSPRPLPGVHELGDTLD